MPKVLSAEDVLRLLPKVQRELEFILKRAPACPDPGEGGCIGEHCIRCAAREIEGALGL